MKHLTHLGGISLLVLMAGCAGTPPPEPTPADAMRDRAGVTAKFAEQWDQGKSMIQTGEQQIQEGEQELKQAREQRRAADELERAARAKITEGRNNITQGTALQEKSEREYAESLPQSRRDP